ncbi:MULTISPECIES: HlyD family efflux transporter periplasmic adaptor subunit [Erythrobacteraceae]|uniref:HlyD family efflux transporter periplasmic adaptor subunit n=1 Tax=Erythrobacteraceae TaxID=335929 RepID=UPI0010F8289E|nr:HlyD family efflux transporter periplasmic adaptor subunit [Parerythrobacter lutipelagi]
MSRRRIIGLAALAALVIAFVLTSGFGLWTAESEGELTLYGNVDIREVDLAFENSGRVEEIQVEEGDRVESGAVLAFLDPARSKDRMRQAEADVAQARAALTRARNGNRPQDIAQGQARLDAARITLAKSESDVDRRRPLVAEGAISRELWDRTLAEARRARAQLREAEQALALLRAGTRNEDIAVAQARVDAALAQQSSVQTDLNDTRLKAPVAGIVVTRAVEPGTLVQPGTPAFTLAIDRPVRIRAYVAEPDLTRIEPGMRVNVMVDGRTEPYRGQIGYISPQAEFTPKSVETEELRSDLVYRVRIVVDNADGGLRQGQPVTVTIPQARPAGDE